jgi:hypothetical protein
VAVSIDGVEAVDAEEAVSEVVRDDVPDEVPVDVAVIRTASRGLRIL